MALLACQNVSLKYDANVIVRDITFSVNSGDYLCVVGENGSGKTTLIKTLLGLHAPSSGTIVTGDGLKRNEIGYLPQQTLVQRDFPASVYEIVLSGCQGRCGMRPFYNKAEKRLAAESMERMGIARFAGRSYRDLSGGQQQRVLLARAFCSTQKLLLLDEPVSGLDPNATEDMYRLIQELHDDGVTIIMISHDIPSALRYATHILHIGGERATFQMKEAFVQNGAGGLPPESRSEMR
ncbi:metal ABC transporter ATP-binding protein [Treponema socranskii]|uniref:metal ABC transporter ATP-binding protein n=1 Tax=Treponema socranskii TaxID=53419 RepID=UPI0028711E07|nr:ABC transporter ATP-binding protein [Treponema socranskii]MDR9858237.1 ABC transporter ATP-binding protein [Treponema socranskii]